MTDTIDEQDPFDDPFADMPDPTPKPARPGGYLSTTFELNLSLTPFGLPYSSVKLGGHWSHPTPVDENSHYDTLTEMSQAAIAQLATQIGPQLAEAVSQLAPALPAQPAGAYATDVTSQQQASAQQLPPATGTPAQQAAAIINQQAAPGGGLVTVTNAYGRDMTVVPMSALSSRDLEEAAKAAFCGPNNIHPTQVRVFDNRADLIAGTDRSGHCARIVVANTAPDLVKAAVGRNSVGWVDFNRDGSLSVKATKQFLEIRDPQVLLAISQPSAGGQF